MEAGAPDAGRNPAGAGPLPIGPPGAGPYVGGALIPHFPDPQFDIITSRRVTHRLYKIHHGVTGAEGRDCFSNNLSYGGNSSSTKTP